MDGDSFCGEDDNFDWGSEDEREIENYGLSSSSSLTVPGAEATASSAEASSSVGSSGSKLIDHFVGMGFPEKMVAEAIQENGEENTDLILETLLKCSARSSASSSGSKLIDHFIGMGFDAEMVAKAIQENGKDSYLLPGIISRQESLQLSSFECLGEGNTDTILETLLTYSAIAKSEPKQGNTLVFLSRMGYTVEEASIAMSDVEKGKEFQPEVLGLLMFSLAICRDLFMARIHNFGCESLSLSRPDATIAELTDFICAAQMAKAADASFPEEKPKLKLFDDNYPKHKKRSYYEYDKWKKKQRLRLEKRMLQGDDEMIRLPNPMIGFGVPTDPAIVTRRTLPEAAIGPPYFYYENVALAPKDRIRKAIEDYEGDPPLSVQKFVLDECRKWNLVDTVAYHLSVLKDLFPGDLRSKQKYYENAGGSKPINRELDIVDVQQLNADRLEQLMSSFGGFDLVIGGSPCNNLAGSNRHHRDGLEGKESSLFFDFCRILDLVKCYY
ncbi:hypothetical protein GH714_010061 [Hevea brasiliensis]|uniref:SAM-dependent MTase DRM-type domain-containing protein n=1 Tax=Hevea brasiliensis TaxID=3981 RepID=A0A6A6M968_HEVBR|nr:hypothetical protein GH714_010061 [Hevea brasiliensis]